LLCLRW